MATLHIEHAISDFNTWAKAFDGFADQRSRAGVRASRIQQPVGDRTFVVIDLEFDTVNEAEGFLQFLKANVWGVRENSPALAGDPKTSILVPAGAS